MVWWGIPFFAITLLAALRSIPGDLYEAASIDGASKVAAVPPHPPCRYCCRPSRSTVMLRTVWVANFPDLNLVIRPGAVPSERDADACPSYIFTTSLSRSLNFGYARRWRMVTDAALVVYAIGVLTPCGGG